MSLRLDWCSHEAAKWACEHWHYSRRTPKAKLAKVGVWEDAAFVGAIVFGLGATPEIGKPFGLSQHAVCELVRVALRAHRYRVTQMLAVSLRMVRTAFPKLRLVVSFADTTQGHHGGIYQAGNWLYLGSQEYHAYRVRGEVFHPRSLHHLYGVGGQSVPWLRAHVDPQAERIANGVKHKYVYPLDPAMRAQLQPLAKPYPRRQPLESEGPSDQGGHEGAAMRPVGSTEAA
jgi:hypothetical protein